MMNRCMQCSRGCFADRSLSEGFCASPAGLTLARAAVHLGEEPCLCGTRGSGAVFFCGCNLRCIFCQNHEISRGGRGRTITEDELTDILHRLEDQGVHNIDLVTPTHYTDTLVRVLSKAKLSIPVVWNSSGYESTESLRKLEGLVQIYLPDFKYTDPKLAAELSFAPDYPDIALAAVLEMYRQTGPFLMDENSLLKSGVILRHLILPGHIENTLRMIDLMEDVLPTNQILFSLMSQYTPIEALKSSPGMQKHPELLRKLTQAEYDRVMDYLDFSSVEEGYFQELSSAGTDMIPAFDGTGL